MKSFAYYDGRDLKEPRKPNPVCPSCRFRIPRGARLNFCPVCGRSLAQVNREIEDYPKKVKEFQEKKRKREDEFIKDLFREHNVDKRVGDRIIQFMYDYFDKYNLNNKQYFAEVFADLVSLIKEASF